MAASRDVGERECKRTGWQAGSIEWVGRGQGTDDGQTAGERAGVRAGSHEGGCEEGATHA